MLVTQELKSRPQRAAKLGVATTSNAKRKSARTRNMGVGSCEGSPAIAGAPTLGIFSDVRPADRRDNASLPRFPGRSQFGTICPLIVDSRALHAFIPSPDPSSFFLHGYPCPRFFRPA